MRYWFEQEEQITPENLIRIDFVENFNGEQGHYCIHLEAHRLQKKNLIWSIPSCSRSILSSI